MKLKRFLLRYYPPGIYLNEMNRCRHLIDLLFIRKSLQKTNKKGIILEYEQQNVLKTKSVDLLDLKAK
jgi:hypothetical protein